MTNVQCTIISMNNEHRLSDLCMYVVLYLKFRTIYLRLHLFSDHLYVFHFSFAWNRNFDFVFCFCVCFKFCVYGIYCSVNYGHETNSVSKSFAKCSQKPKWKQIVERKQNNLTKLLYFQLYCVIGHINGIGSSTVCIKLYVCIIWNWNWITKSSCHRQRKAKSLFKLIFANGSIEIKYFER